MSLDGFIVGPEDDISGFTADGAGIDHYLEDLKDFDTVIMGRKTYEFGYKFGLQPGQPAYPHMQHYIFSDSLKLPDQNPQVKVLSPDIDTIKNLKKGDGSDIYLCGGGIFAGWLLSNKLVDELKIKLNPVVLGDGIPLFGANKSSCHLRERETLIYPGLHIIHYEIEYADS